jgi:hypothetical protein
MLRALTAEPRKRLRRLITGAALACAGAAFGAVGLGFATWALFVTMQAQWGVADTAAAIAAGYFVVAIILFACRANVVSPDASPMRSAGIDRSDEAIANAADSADALAKKIAAGNAARAGGFAASDELAKQLTPVQLVMLAALNGFISGRKS